MTAISTHSVWNRSRSFGGACVPRVITWPRDVQAAEAKYVQRAPNYVRPRLGAGVAAHHCTLAPGSASVANCKGSTGLWAQRGYLQLTGEAVACWGWFAATECRACQGSSSLLGVICSDWVQNLPQMRSEWAARLFGEVAARCRPKTRRMQGNCARAPVDFLMVAGSGYFRALKIFTTKAGTETKVRIWQKR
jgi:hypothetical protein